MLKDIEDIVKGVRACTQDDTIVWTLTDEEERDDYFSRTYVASHNGIDLRFLRRSQGANAVSGLYVDKIRFVLNDETLYEIIGANYARNLKKKFFGG
jgi:hypothetical protein